MKLVYLVRHGESEANVGPVRQGPESPLTEKGRREAARIAARAKQLPVQALVASPFPRARETAEIVSEEIGMPVQYSDLFVERRFPSSLIGIRHDDPLNREVNRRIREHFAEADWRDSDEESFDDLKQRAEAALAFLESLPEEHVLVVGHGMFARILAARIVMGPELTGRECEQFIRALRTNTTGLTVFRHDGAVEESSEGAESPWKLIVWNDHAHLADIGPGGEREA